MSERTTTPVNDSKGMSIGEPDAIANCAFCTVAGLLATTAEKLRQDIAGQAPECKKEVAPKYFIVMQSIQEKKTMIQARILR